MGMFERVATAGLDCLFYVFLYANVFRAVPASTANECGADLYPRVVRTYHYLVLTALAAGTLFLAVRTAAWAAGAGALAAAGWKRRLLRGTLLLGVALSFAASILAEVTFEKGFLHRAGCHPYHVAYGLGSPTGAHGMGVVVMGIFLLLHGLLAWVAVTQNCYGPAAPWSLIDVLC